MDSKITQLLLCQKNLPVVQGTQFTGHNLAPAQYNYVGILQLRLWNNEVNQLLMKETVDGAKLGNKARNMSWLML